MSRKARNVILTFVALIFIGVAAVLSIMLMSDEPSIINGSDISDKPAAEEITQAYDGLLPMVVQSKYLWEYGVQQVAAEKPSDAPTTKKDESSSELNHLVSAESPETYAAVVTNWKGETVTDENGKPVTELHTVPKTVKFTQYVTDANGERVTDSRGKPVTEVCTSVINATSAPVAVTDADGNKVTDANGKVVTEKATTAKTTSAVGNTAVTGSKHWAQGITDGDSYTEMKIYIDGKCNISKSSVMVMTLREKSGLIAMPSNLTYNISKGTCTVSPSKKYSEMAYVSYVDGKTIVTLIIPESVRPATNNTTTFKASSTISTFSDENGTKLDEFTVSVF